MMFGFLTSSRRIGDTVNVTFARDGKTQTASVELGELASLRRADLDRAKAFFSSRNDHYRPPYGRISQDFPRQCIFGGSINPDVNGYLTDPTGNRRFWPVGCGFIDIEGLRDLILDPGPDFAKTPAQTVQVLRANQLLAPRRHAKKTRSAVFRSSHSRSSTDTPSRRSRIRAMDAR